jgi:hypothetical protein
MMYVHQDLNFIYNFWWGSQGVAEVGVGREMQPHGQQSPRGHKIGVKINTLNGEKNYFLRSTDFKLLSKIEGNSIICCDCYSLQFFFKGCHCGYSPRTPKTLVTLLKVPAQILQQRSLVKHAGYGGRVHNGLRKTAFGKFLVGKTELRKRGCLWTPVSLKIHTFLYV